MQSWQRRERIIIFTLSVLSMTWTKNKWHFINSLFIACSVISLIFPALVNGYPLFYPDSGAYIASGFDNHIPVDRPMMYCFFVRHISMADSLWFVIVAQAILVTAFINVILKKVTQSKFSVIYSFLTIVFLSCSTGIANYTSQIMADIFTGIAISGLCFFLTFSCLSKGTKIFLSILIIFSIASHSSNLLTASLLIGLMILFSKLIAKYFQIPFKKIAAIGGLVVACWLLIPTINSLFEAGFKVSRAPNIFFMGRLMESGILEDYLKENCQVKPNELCEYVGHLPKYSGDFLWGNDSPLYAGGCNSTKGSDCWLVKNNRYAPIVKDIFTTPKYIGRYLLFAVNESWKQINCNFTADLIPQAENSSVIDNISWHYKKDYQQYISASQAKSPFMFHTVNRVQNIIVPISFFALLLIFILKKYRDRMPSNLRLFILLSLAGILFNDAVCATFSTVDSRFEGRVIWILPFLLILYLLSQLKRSADPNGNSTPE
jgi:hypothetical protein